MSDSDEDKSGSGGANHRGDGDTTSGSSGSPTTTPSPKEKKKEGEDDTGACSDTSASGKTRQGEKTVSLDIKEEPDQDNTSPPSDCRSNTAWVIALIACVGVALPAFRGALGNSDDSFLDALKEAAAEEIAKAAFFFVAIMGANAGIYKPDLEKFLGFISDILDYLFAKTYPENQPEVEDKDGEMIAYERLTRGERWSVAIPTIPFTFAGAVTLASLYTQLFAEEPEILWPEFVVIAGVGIAFVGQATGNVFEKLVRMLRGKPTPETKSSSKLIRYSKNAIFTLGIPAYGLIFGKNAIEGTFQLFNLGELSLSWGHWAIGFLASLPLTWAYSNVTANVMDVAEDHTRVLALPCRQSSAYTNSISRCASVTKDIFRIIVTDGIGLASVMSFFYSINHAIDSGEYDSILSDEVAIIWGNTAVFCGMISNLKGLNSYRILQTRLSDTKRSSKAIELDRQHSGYGRLVTQSGNGNGGSYMSTDDTASMDTGVVVEGHPNDHNGTNGFT